MDLQLLEAKRGSTAPDRHIVGTESESEMAAKRRARARIGCDLLLARLFKNHPDHAMAALKGVQPRVIDLEPPPGPDHGGKIVLLPVASNLKASDLRQIPDFEIILQRIASFYDVSVIELCSRNRTKAVTWPRQVAVYLARQMTPMTLFNIAHALGGRDHTTLSSSVAVVQRELAGSERLRDEIEILMLSIKESVVNIAASKSVAVPA